MRSLIYSVVCLKSYKTELNILEENSGIKSKVECSLVFGNAINSCKFISIYSSVQPDDIVKAESPASATL